MSLPVAEMLQPAGRWFAEEGPLQDGILSTRVRLARNLRGLRFPARALPEEQTRVMARVANCAAQTAEFGGCPFHAMTDFSVLERQFLLERRLISHDLAGEGGCRGLVFSADESVSVMVNEEDHLRLQTLRSGFQLDACYAAASELDDHLGGTLEYAFSDTLGYLTACPTNVGTGLRASVLAHLPGLVLTRRIKKVLAGVTQVGFAVRGFYGEGTDVLGNFFQISNQVTLGEKESQILLNLERVVHQVLAFEEKAREVLLKDAAPQIQDKVMRALGVLRHAQLLSTEELIGLASAVRLGFSLGLSEMPSASTLNELLLFGQSAHLQMAAHQELNSAARNAQRAAYVRRALATAGAATER